MHPNPNSTNFFLTQVKNENLTSYLALLNQTLEFLISKDFPVNSSKFKALNQNFQVDCVICNEQRLVLWKLLPVAPKGIIAPSDELLVRVMKHFAGKGTPSFGPVTARVDSIDVGAEASSELGKRRRESEAENGSSSIAKVTGITTDSRAIVPTAARTTVTAKSQITASSATGASNSAAKYSISAITAADGAVSSALPTAPAVSTTVTAPVPATSVTWPNKPFTANSTAAASSVRAVPLPMKNKVTATAIHTTAPILPPKATAKPSVQATAKPGAVMKNTAASIDVPGPAGPWSRLDTAAAVSSVFTLPSGTKEMAQWLRDSPPAATKTVINPVSSVTGTSVTTTTAMSTSEVVPPHKKRKSSVQPLPLSDLLRVVSSSKAPAVLDLTSNPCTNHVNSTATGTAVVPIVPAVSAQLPVAPTVPAVPLSLPAPTQVSNTKNAHELSPTESNASCAKEPMVTTTVNITAQTGPAPSHGTHNNANSSVGVSAADSNSSSSTTNADPVFASVPVSEEDPAIGKITLLPSNKPAQSWHASSDANLRPLIIKSMIMKHKDYKLHKHEPAWVASRRKGCEIFEAMQYHNCRTRLEYLTQTGVNIC